MTIGIWTNNESLENQKRLYDMGFRGATIGCPYSGISWEEVVDKMYNERYLPLKQIGYTHFLLQMRSPDTRYQDLVIAKFKDCQDVEYLCGEPYELVEEQGWSEYELGNHLVDLESDIIIWAHKQLCIDIQLRLWDKHILEFLPKVPSSYFWQQRVWYEGMPSAWIYVDVPTLHSLLPFIGSYAYKSLKRKADKLGITTFYAYQADTAENFFANKFWKFLGLENWWKETMLKRFTKIFNTMGEK